jgi:hypothetical protein
LSLLSNRGGIEPESKDLGGLDAEVHPTASCCRERAAGRLGMERANSASVIPCENHEVLRLRSDSRVDRSKTFRLAPLRMTELFCVAAFLFIVLYNTLSANTLGLQLLLGKRLGQKGAIFMGSTERNSYA